MNLSGLNSLVWNVSQGYNLTVFSRFRERRFLASPFISVRLSAWNISTPTGRIFMKFNILVFLRSVENIQVS
jgi:hypothetical protein